MADSHETCSNSRDTLLRDDAHERAGFAVETTGIISDVDSSSTRGLSNYFYSHDGIELLFCVSVAAASTVLKFIDIDPRQRPIPYQLLESTGEYIVNQVNNEEFNGDTVSGNQLYLYGFLIPLIIQLTLSYCHGYRHLHMTICVYSIAMGLTQMLTSSTKLYVGYLRPVFYDLCEVDEDYQTCASSIANEGRKSFPSGHASLSFCGLSLISFYLERRFGVSRLREWRVDPSSGELRLVQHRAIGLERVVSVLCHTPLLLAFFIASSRVADNKHFPADVVGGSLLGASISKFVHSIWFD